MSQQAVTNSTCLIGLERIGRLDLLPQVFAVVFAPPMVVAEVQSTLTLIQADFRISNAIIQEALRLAGEGN